MSSPIAAVAPAASATASETAQLAALTKLQATYAADIKAGQTTAELQSLGQQITAAAAALGESVSLPQATPAAPAASTTSTAKDVMPPGYA
jgi:uncharacterized caspase-like protein